jgi:polyisoprenoid-binding protein YceI
MPRTPIAVFALLASLVAPSAAAAPAAYEIDPSHSRVGFRIRHTISHVGGSFDSFSGTVRVDREDLTRSGVTFVIDAASIDTGNAKRDEHLRSADFFDVAKFPEMRFESTGIAKGAGNVYQVTGKFTMHGVTREITVPVELLGFAPGMRGGEMAGFHATFPLDRKAYGIEWNRALDSGGVLLSDEVLVEIDLETVRRPPPEAPAPAAKP